MATKYVSSLTGPEMDAALIDMAYHNSEAYAVGTRNGVAVGSSDVTYHNNAKYYAEQTGADAQAAETAAARAEAAVPAGTAGAVFFDRAQSLTTAQQAQARANIMAGGSNDNLLDNAYFVGGGSQLGDGVFPINQRGQTSYSGAGRYIDRWIALNNASGMTLNADGIVFSNPESGYGYVAQSRTRAKAQSGYTLSVLTADGTVYTAQGTNSITLPSGLYFYWGNQTQLTVRVPANLTASETIAAVKYEKGSYSTLVNDVPPDFGEELAKCKAYFQRVKQPQGYTAPIGFGIIGASSNILRTLIPLSSPLRDATSITASATNMGQMKVWGNGSYFTPSAITGRTVLNGHAVVDITVSGSLQNHMVYHIILENASTYIDLSAEL